MKHLFTGRGLAFRQPRWAMVLVLHLIFLASVANAQSERQVLNGVQDNLIRNGNFRLASSKQVPEGWKIVTVRPSLSPVFQGVEIKHKSMLHIKGNGKKDAVGAIETEVPLELGKTYLFSVLFRISDEINPQRNLLFQLFSRDNKDGIFDYVKKPGGWIEGSARINLSGTGLDTAVARIIFRFSEHGSVTISNISLKEVEKVQPRWVRIACTSGHPTFDAMRKVIETAAAEGADIVLLPEYMNTGENSENLDGPSCRMMAEMAAKHRLYIAGGIVRKDDTNDRIYNTVVLYDRVGAMAGMYDKIHPYSPEVYPMGVTPGQSVTVLNTDFGRVGFMTCYDSWFTDVAELVSLKGAELILFPNAGYYRSLLPARATDNNVRIVASSLYNDNGIWDTQGRDVANPDLDPTYFGQDGTTFKDVKSLQVDNMKVLVASLDLNFSPSPHHNGGTMMSSPAGRRNRSEQLYYLDDDIRREKERWWVSEEEKRTRMSDTLK